MRMHHVKLTENLRTIADMIPEHARVLDIGCARGHLLAWLTHHKSVHGRGIELSNEKVQYAISRGLSVVQGDAEVDIHHYQHDAYDYIILNQILQQMRDPVQMLKQASHIARHVIVSVPNFGHWRNRWYFAWHGRMPVTKQLSYQWYETPNIHFCTLRDFSDFVTMLELRIDHTMIQSAHYMPDALMQNAWCANVFGQKGIFLLSRGADQAS
ncbi:MAG: methionine biosynthesis protein MetW [Alphaproteobacteria bacterium]|nr:MAG: methionine biosynthesis protein MetW [Alphaproteobacteria bacterium]TAF14290.1 MAG: methionine biosynthesis protein MetW [Alphaproteobacteria bacterium]TAF38751.1 MAG: methionine biosynthesis protein MetW [Alphaproteobacteria bacterium]TAF76478.1 MAG: methionine biosynthesis protein MetW [Alphaproteobacteria bacterium]